MCVGGAPAHLKLSPDLLVSVTFGKQEPDLMLARGQFEFFWIDFHDLNFFHSLLTLPFRRCKSQFSVFINML